MNLTNKKFLTLVLLVFILSVLIVFGQIKDLSKEPTKLSADGKEDFVFYKISASPTMQEYTETLAKVREFIWKHLKLKKQGTIKLEAFSKEGERSVSTYQIKCSENDKCRIFVKIEREIVGRGKLSREKSDETIEFIADQVDRAKFSKDYFYNSERKIIDENLNISPMLFRIRLKDAEGKVISEI